jgi:hypothetical protein
MHSIKINGKVAPEVKYYLIKIYGRIGVKFWPHITAELHGDKRSASRSRRFTPDIHRIRSLLDSGADLDAVARSNIYFL